MFFADVNIASVVTPETLEASRLSIEIEEEFGLLCPDKRYIEANPWLVHTFWSIGMADPFPDESTVMEEHNKWIDGAFAVGAAVYPASRYTPDHSPAMLYVPSQYMMIKIIRACMGCAVPGDLWFHHGATAYHCC